MPSKLAPFRYELRDSDGRLIGSFQPSVEFAAEVERNPTTALREQGFRQNEIKRMVRVNYPTEECGE